MDSPNASGLRGIPVVNFGEDISGLVALCRTVFRVTVWDSSIRVTMATTHQDVSSMSEDSCINFLWRYCPASRRRIAIKLHTVGFNVFWGKQIMGMRVWMLDCFVPRIIKTSVFRLRTVIVFHCENEILSPVNVSN